MDNHSLDRPQTMSEMAASMEADFFEARRWFWNLNVFAQMAVAKSYYECQERRVMLAELFRDLEERRV